MLYLFDKTTLWQSRHWCLQGPVLPVRSCVWLVLALWQEPHTACQLGTVLGALREPVSSWEQELVVVVVVEQCCVDRACNHR